MVLHSRDDLSNVAKKIVFLWVKQAFLSIQPSACLPLFHLAFNLA